MSFQQAQSKFNELMTYLISNYRDYTPNYKSYEEFSKTNGRSHQDNINKFERALKYFQGQDIGRGQKPKLTTYITQIAEDHTDEIDSEDINDTISEEEEDEDKNTIILNSKNDFLSNKMTYNSIDDFNPKPRLTKEERAQLQEALRGKKAGAFPSLYAITKQGLGVSHNPNYLRKDFFDDVIKAKHPEWERTTNIDVDGDTKNDIAIWDSAGRDAKNLRYYNGWGISNNKLARPYVDYLIKNPDKDQSYRFGYLPQRPEHKEHKPIIDVEETFNKFVEAIDEKLGELSPKLRMIKAQFGFKQKLKSMINRFVILPYALIKLNYNPDDIKPIIYNDAKFTQNKKLMSMYRSKAVRKVWKDEGQQLVEATIQNVQEEILNLAANDPAGFIDLVIKGDKVIRDILYNDAVESATA